MNINGKYFIPEKIEDKTLRSASVKLKVILKDNAILEDILKKYIVAYNKTLNQRGSAKSLEVMNQNRNLVFSKIAFSGVKKSPRCTRFDFEKDDNVPISINPQQQTPQKTNRVNSKTERKRLSFDVAENEYMKPVQAFTEGFEANQMHLDISSPFLKCDEEPELYDDSEEMCYIDGIPLYASASSFHDQAVEYQSIKSPDEDQTMVITHENKNISPINFINKEKGNPWYFESRPSFYSLEILPKAFDSPDKYIQERFNLEGKPETITKLDISDHDNTDLSTKTPDKHEAMISSPEKKTNAPVNDIAECRKNARSFVSKKEDKDFEKHNTIRLDENENVSSLPVDHQNISCTSYKTPEKLQTFSTDANKEEKRTKKQIAVKRFTAKIASNEKDNLSPMKDAQTSSNLPIKKRKFIDNSEESEIPTSQVTDEHEFITPTKIFKLKEAFSANVAKCTISPDPLDVNGSDSILTNDESPICTKTSFSSVMVNNDSSNHAGDNFIANEDVAQSHGKSIMSVFATNNNCDFVSVSPAEKSVRSELKTSIKKENGFYFSPKADKKMAVEVLPDIGNLRNDKNKTSEQGTKDVESLTNLMKNLSPSVKRSSDGEFQKFKINRSVGDDAILEGKLFLQDKLSKTATPPKECFIPYKPSPKTDDSFTIQAIKFIVILKQRRNRFSKYLHLFVGDRDDLKFICKYIRALDAVQEEIPIHDNNQALINTVNSFVNKCFKLLHKAYTWKMNIERDLDVWEDCIQKINQMEQDVKRLVGEKHDMNPKDFQKIEESFRIVNKKADDMILLREIKRPTNIQFLYELKHIIQLFFQIMIEIGILKHSSISSDQRVI